VLFVLVTALVVGCVIGIIFGLCTKDNVGADQFKGIYASIHSFHIDEAAQAAILPIGSIVGLLVGLLNQLWRTRPSAYELDERDESQRYENDLLDI